MVIGMHGHEYAIGERGRGLRWLRRKGWLDQPYVVLREATMDEWIATLREFGLSDAEIAEDVALVCQGARFYEVSTD